MAQTGISVEGIIEQLFAEERLNVEDLDELFAEDDDDGPANSDG